MSGSAIAVAGASSSSVGRRSPLKFQSNGDVRQRLISKGKPSENSKDKLRRGALKTGKNIPPYKNPRLSASQRVADLLSRMTLEEKAAQMTCIWQQKAEKLLDANGNFD